MPGDAESRITQSRQPDLWALPDIASVTILRIRYPTPRRHALAGRSVAVEEGIEIVVRTDGEIPIRALSPALYVGDIAVVENETVEPGLHRFFVLDETPERGAPIVLGWVGQPPPPSRRESRFRYEPPA